MNILYSIPLNSWLCPSFPPSLPIPLFPVFQLSLSFFPWLPLLTFLSWLLFQGCIFYLIFLLLVSCSSLPFSFRCLVHNSFPLSVSLTT